MQKARDTNPEKCNQIKRASIARNRAAVNMRQREDYKKHAESRKEKVRIYREKNQEEIKKKRQEKYQKNKNVIAKRDSEYRLKNREKIKARDKKYREGHRTETRLRNRSRKLKLEYSIQDFSKNDWQACLKYWENKCAACGRSVFDGKLRLAMDHWHPLAKGGLTCKMNIIPLCHGENGCNNQKKDKLPFDWLKTRFGEHLALRIYTDILIYFFQV